MRMPSGWRSPCDVLLSGLHAGNIGYGGATPPGSAENTMSHRGDATTQRGFGMLLCLTAGTRRRGDSCFNAKTQHAKKRRSSLFLFPFPRACSREDAREAVVPF